MRLNNKVAIITGAGNGMGACEARLFAKEGAIVVATDIDAAAAKSVADDIRAHGGTAMALHHDISNQSDWQTVVAATLDKFGRVDILVNNAALHLEQRMADITVADWKRTIDIDLTGAFLGTQSVIPGMRERKQGVIVNISSIAAIKGSSFAHYSAAKGGLRSLTKTTAIEYAKDHIRCNAVLPGLIETKLTANALANDQMRAMLQAAVPWPRFGRPEDVAHGVLFLASDEAAFITGAELVIDGGTTAM